MINMFQSVAYYTVRHDKNRLFPSACHLLHCHCSLGFGGEGVDIMWTQILAGELLCHDYKTHDHFN